MFLIDTNIFLEGLLEQEKTHTVRLFFEKVDLNDLFVTDFTLCSIGIILFKLNKHDVFTSFIEDMIVDGIQVLSLKTQYFTELEKLSKRYKLDFDDAYQYLVAKYHDLQIISFDRHFDKTELKRKIPAEVV